MKRLLTLVVLLLVAFSFSAAEVSADTKYEEYEGREYYSEYKGTSLAGDEWTVRVWISDTYFTGKPIFIRYETENIEFEALSIQGSYLALDDPYIRHNEKRGIIILTNRYFFNKIYTGDLYTREDDVYFIYGAIIFTSENRRYSYVKSMYIGVTEFQDEWQHKYDRYVRRLERGNRRGCGGRRR